MERDSLFRPAATFFARRLRCPLERARRLEASSAATGSSGGALSSCVEERDAEGRERVAKVRGMDKCGGGVHDLRLAKKFHSRPASRPVRRHWRSACLPSHGPPSLGPTGQTVVAVVQREQTSTCALAAAASWGRKAPADRCTPLCVFCFTTLPIVRTNSHQTPQRSPEHVKRGPRPGGRPGPLCRLDRDHLLRRRSEGKGEERMGA